MKPGFEMCMAPLAGEEEAYICSFECTFCASCTSDLQRVCPHCGGELVLRPRRRRSLDRELGTAWKVSPKKRSHKIWAISFGIWTIVSLAATATAYAVYGAAAGGMRLSSIAGIEFTQILCFAPLTPIAFAFAVRYPVRREIWLERSLLHLGASIVFTFGHIALKAPSPFAYWDREHKEWSSALWNVHQHKFRNPLSVLKGVFLVNVVDDITGAYLPIVIVAHAVSTYGRLHENQLRATQLESQLAKARLQTLKSQMQPHFLFNTLHSISALMLTDVSAADEMMTCLSDLLRMSLESNEIQVTTLSREIEFLEVYLRIEKIRFEERLHVLFEIAPECLDAQVPHLLLQPLVENAVRHGVSRQSAPGQILIAASHEGHELKLWIRDNGPGLAEPSEHRDGHGMGLAVTRERLLALYGAEQTCEIRNGEQGGVEVYVRLPFFAATRTPRVEIGQENCFAGRATTDLT